MERRNCFRSETVVVVLAVLTVVIGICSGECTDSVGNGNAITVVSQSTGKKLGKAKSCADIFTKWPSLCEATSGDLVIGGEGGRCCVTCGDTTCLDKLTKRNNYKIGKTKISSCTALVTNYKGLCTTVGIPGGSCCRACTGVDLSCVDNPLIRFNVGKKALGCAKYIAGDGCRCDKTTECCESCQGVDTAALGCDCQDLLSPNSPSTIIITDPSDGAEVLRQEVTHCNVIVSFFTQFCDASNLGGEGKACCKSCTGVDTTCSDNLLWKGSVSKKKKSCNNCNCHEIAKAGKSLMKQACKNNISADGSGWKIRKACCLQCKKVGY